MREEGVPVPPTAYTLILGALEKAGEWQKAVNLLLQMQTRGVRVDSKAVDVTIGTCSRAGQWAMIIKLFDQMPIMTRNTFVPTEITYTHVINAAWKLSDSNKAVSVLEAMAASGLLPPFASISQVIATLEASSLEEDKERSVSIFERFVMQHLPPNFYTHTHTHTSTNKNTNTNTNTNTNMNMNTHASTHVNTHTHTSMSAQQMVVDLHQLTIPVAKAAIRSALLMLEDEEEELKSIPPPTRTSTSTRTTTSTQTTTTSTAPKATASLVLITGIGRNSKQWLDPVLKPALIEWLANDFSPPLHAVELQDNPGRLGITAADIGNFFDRINNRNKR